MCRSMLKNDKVNTTLRVILLKVHSATPTKDCKDLCAVLACTLMMETCWTVLAAVLLIASHCKSATLTIDPNPLSISGNATGSAVNVTMKCSPPVAFDSLVSLVITRNLTSNLSVSIQIAAATIRNVSARMLKDISGASASGSLPEKFILVTMTLISCNDAGTYRCIAYYFIGSIISDPSVDKKNFTVQVLPGQITLTAMPQYTYYETILEMSCNGQVGGTTNGTRISWVWEYQDYEGSTWNSYMTNSSDIAPPTPSLPDNSCQNNQVSVLKRRLTQEDSRRTYRCYVRRNGQSYVEFAGMYQIGTLVAGVAWWIIVITVVGGVILCLVIGIVIFIIRRNQICENKHSQDEEESKEDDEISDVPPSNVQKMKTYLHLDSVLKKISRLASDRESAVDASEGASTRFSVSSQGTIKNA